MWLVLRHLENFRCSNSSMHWHHLLLISYLPDSCHMDQMLPPRPWNNCRLYNLYTGHFPPSSCTCLPHKRCTCRHQAHCSLLCIYSSPKYHCLEPSTSCQDMVYMQRLRLASTYLHYIRRDTCSFLWRLHSVQQDNQCMQISLHRCLL